MEQTHEELEALNASLNDPTTLEEYKKPYDDYKPHLLPRILGHMLVWCGNTVYGKAPSYLKFRAVEVIARVPYHSWDSAAFTFLTMFYQNESKAMRLAKLSQFARLATDNETMHVVVISALAKAEQKDNVLVHTVIPMLFAFFYFWAAYWLYVFNPRNALELNYLFESHAFEQYSRFLEANGEELKKKPMVSKYLEWYGREAPNQYEFFRSVRNDEIMHRNKSIEEIERRG
ncbi:MAG: alternative oxidase [Patescibacteria group bacterium]